MLKTTIFIAATVLAGQAFAASQELIERGKYMAQASDCIACHTKPGGQPFSGGLAMSTPLGDIYTTNITPDAETGIGSYSLEEFSEALREGESPKGRLYPAMPYTAYAKLTDDDIAALYAYFQEGVKPVQQQNLDSDIPWPLSMRWPLSIWQGLFMESGVYETNPEQDEQWNRGAYLVQGAGHCGACHTPRGIGFQEKAMTEKGSEFLSGTELDNWWVTSLRGDWKTGIGALSVEEIASLLKTGKGGQISVSGSMAEVVSHSTQHLTDDDLTAMAVYLKSLSPAIDSIATNVNAPVHNGAELYGEYCSTCHGNDGAGYLGVIPSLSGNATINAEKPYSAIRVILHGAISPESGPDQTIRRMPAYQWQLSDKQVAELMTFMRSRWGNDAKAISADVVKELR